MAEASPLVLLNPSCASVPMSTTFETIPEELIHAARSLGADFMRCLPHIILPLSVPGLLAGGLLSFTGSFEEFHKSFVVGAPVIQTLPIKLYMYLAPSSRQLAIVFFTLLLPAFIVFIIAGRIMRDELMAAGRGKI